MTQDSGTSEEWYTERLKKMDSKESFAKKLHTVMYRKHIQNLVTGRVLDVGCGIGMNMRFMSPESVGVDHNPHSVEECRAAGLTAFVPEEFHARSEEFANAFDTIICAHVMEHMNREEGMALLQEYLPYLRATGRIVLITPQEVGYGSDSTHVRFVDFEASRELVESVGLSVKRSESFPLPRPAGKLRRSNEFVVVAERSA